MEDINKKCFGSFGWRQFWQNRIDILAEYDRFKGLNTNHPVRTSHGVAIEAKIREWLTSFLPKKFAVTSGYIVPDIVVNDYTLKHYDIIIYNSLEAPILWIEDNLDSSNIGQKKAIPAKYVHFVLEVKATLNKKNVAESMEKLYELNEFRDYLPLTFSCVSIFAEIANETPNNLKILEEFIYEAGVIGYWGSLILRNSFDQTSSGFVTLRATDQEDNLHPTSILSKSIDNLNIYIDQKGDLKIAEAFCGAALAPTSSSNWSVTKFYCPRIIKNSIDVSVTWSNNSFTKFFIQMIDLLNGTFNERQNFNFGQIYDKVERRIE
jgi:hypothetical protein